MLQFKTDVARRAVAGKSGRKLRITVATLGGLLGCAQGAWSAPVYIGLQETGVNGGAITQEATGSGSASFNGYYGDSTHGYFQLNLSATGTPTLPEPLFNSNAVALTATRPGTISIYMTELNQFPTGFADWYSGFAVSALGAGVSVTESTYIHECAVPNGACLVPADLFAETTLVSTDTFSSTGYIEDFSPNGLPLATAPYAVTEEYTISFAQQNTSAQGAIEFAAPEPMSITILGGALLGLGMVRRGAGRGGRSVIPTID